MTERPRWNVWAVRILLALVILAFLPGGIMKTMQHPAVVEGFGRSGIPAGAIVPLGIVELLCLALYLMPPTSVLGTFLLTGYLGGATLANLINRSDFLHALGVGLLVWAGTWFRVAELRALFPLRRREVRPGAEDARPQYLAPQASGRVEHQS